MNLFGLSFALKHLREHLSWFAKLLDTFCSFIEKNLNFRSNIILKEKKSKSDETSLNKNFKIS